MAHPVNRPIGFLSPARSALRTRTMITGSNTVLYTKRPEADRAFLLDVLGFPHVDAGGGYLVFAVTPSEISVQPHRKKDVHEFHLTCDNVRALVRALRRRRIRCGPIEALPWGDLTRVSLPGGGKLAVYKPRYERPKPLKRTPRRRR